ncbi:hypothetical protein COU37_05055 [Candidatus Micrarchaeota archaeon CG10_big_fil_rev_8_21_14_0_10_45_29]|nr:MAG: hypothetical protein COU37_05055 [Candidatus Micrarchaeota archaeon CG10_big_fil_rev_8_21_14_0_10_45_29]
MISALLDTNVILNWLTISRASEENKKKFKREVASKYSNFELLERIGKKELAGDFRISNISKAEFIRLICEKLCWDKMAQDGVSGYDFHYYYEKMEITEADKYEIIRGIVQFEAGFIDSKMIKYIRPRKLDAIWLTLLLSKYKLTPQDALIVTEGIMQGCKYMVTSDKRLIDATKKIGKIKIVHPQKFMEIIRSENNENPRH